MPNAVTDCAGNWLTMATIKYYPLSYQWHFRFYTGALLQWKNIIVESFFAGNISCLLWKNVKKNRIIRRRKHLKPNDRFSFFLSFFFSSQKMNYFYNYFLTKGWNWETIRRRDDPSNTNWYISSHTLYSNDLITVGRCFVFCIKKVGHYIKHDVKP